MNYPRFKTIFSTGVTIRCVLFLFLSAVLFTPPLATAVPVSFTILHINDFHGQLEATGSNPGAARVAQKINDVRTAVGPANVLLLDAGDAMQGSLLSNLQKGYPVIGTFNAMNFNVATFGNHEFDWGQTILGDRTAQAIYPFVTANIVQNNTGNCGTAGWTLPSFADAPYKIITVNTVKVAVIGVTTPETPSLLSTSATAGLCFKDPADSIMHYYDEMKAAGAKVIVVLSHLGYNDGGYGYGFPVYGDQTLASKLNAAGKPVNLIIGGHSHTDLGSATTVGTTKVVQARYNGRTVGRADVTLADNGTVSINWTKLAVSTSDPKDLIIDALVTSYATDPTYLALVN
jgi:2',3'-cyclic-nucleotide 2'-phosphodiesterase (5'-nucleotidase family)